MQEPDKRIVSTYASIILITFVALLAANFFQISIPINMTSSLRSNELAVVGEGKVDISPDTAYVDVGISINAAKTVEEAQTKINQVNNAIISEMKNLGIPKENIKTSNYSVYPNMSYVQGRDQINGYNGNATITVKTEKLTIVPQIIQSATKAGANQVQGSRFAIEKPEKYRQLARDEAIKNAREQAQQLAKSLGIRLGRVVNIIEASADGQPIPMYAKSDAIGMGGAPEPAIEPGTQTISSTVTLYFEKR